MTYVVNTLSLLFFKSLFKDLKNLKKDLKFYYSDLIFAWELEFGFFKNNKFYIILYILFILYL